MIALSLAAGYPLNILDSVLPAFALTFAWTQIAESGLTRQFNLGTSQFGTFEELRRQWEDKSMPALDEIYAPDIGNYNSSQMMMSVALTGGEEITFRRILPLFPVLLNHRACQTVRNTPRALWNNEEVIKALEKLTSTSAGKFMAVMLGVAGAELWGKTVACDWISGEQGAVLWLEVAPLIPGMTFHVSPPKVVRYPGPAAAPYLSAMMADIQDGSIQVGSAHVTLSSGAVNGLNKVAKGVQKGYGKLVKRGWAEAV